MNKDSNNIPNWAELFQKEEEYLAFELGKILSSGSLPMIPIDKNILIKKADLWIETKRKVICSSNQVRKAVLSADNYIICAAIADALGGSGTATAAVLIVKRGLEKFCKECWNN